MTIIVDGCITEQDLISWEEVMTKFLIDGNKDRVISKSEHRLFFESWKDPLATIDQNMDGLITCNEFAEAGRVHI